MTNPESDALPDGNGERIPIASDHAGCELRVSLGALLTELGYDVDDLGPADAGSVDYADFAHPLAGMVASGDVRRGVLLCGTGLGMSYAANRHAGVRAAVAWSAEIARLARQHNDANVLVLPARFVNDTEAREILRTFLETPFEGGRHTARVAKIELQGDGAIGDEPVTATSSTTSYSMATLTTTDGDTTTDDDGDGRGCGTHEPGTEGT